MGLRAPDVASWRAARAALRARFAELNAAAAEVALGHDVQDERAHNAAVDMVKSDMSTEANPRTRALYSRVISDQIYRFAGTQWQGGLPAIAVESWGGLIGGRTARISCENTIWMHAQLAEIDWFTIPVYGEQADASAWVIVQHADYDRPLQRNVLARLERLVTSGDTAGRNVAYLFDRLAVADGRPQRYGTQVRCAAGQWQSLAARNLSAISMQGGPPWAFPLGRATWVNSVPVVRARRRRVDTLGLIFFAVDRFQLLWLAAPGRGRESDLQTQVDRTS